MNETMQRAVLQSAIDSVAPTLVEARDSWETLDRLADGDIPRGAQGSALRSHLVHWIDADELSFRFRVDRVLALVSRLEVACALGLLDGSFIPHKATFCRALNQPEVRAFYEDLYPLSLPVLFRRRLNDENPLSLRISPVDALSAFSDVMSLSRQLHGLECKRFLNLLDDVSEGVTWEDLFGTLQSPEDIARLFMRDDLRGIADEQKHVRKRELILSNFLGLRVFLSFSTEFARVLSRMDDDLARSAVFHIHGYWYELAGGLVYGALATTLLNLQPLISASKINLQADEIASVKRSTDEMYESLKDLRRLTSSYYRYPIEKLLLA